MRSMVRSRSFLFFLGGSGGEHPSSVCCEEWTTRSTTSSAPEHVASAVSSANETCRNPTCSQSRIIYDNAYHH
ncbi:hypothetical protein C8J56DRAFT_954619, partial [Mycena floridula]